MLQSTNSVDGSVRGGELVVLAVSAAIRDSRLKPSKEISAIAKQTSSVLDHAYPSIDTCHENIDPTEKILAETLLKPIRSEALAEELTTIIGPQGRWRTDVTDPHATHLLTKISENAPWKHQNLTLDASSQKRKNH